MVTQAETRAEASEVDPTLPKSVGRYGVVRLLGEGAMGRVLLAHDPVLQRDVAVKHLRADLNLARDVKNALVTRMRHEARAAARVAHPNLVVLHDMGEDVDLGLFLVFEYVDGPTLKARLLHGALSIEEAARVARELGDALTRAHQAGVLHRDVKPENVMLSAAGAKMADFGIARVPDSTLTHHGGLLGTPAYSAPETFDGGDFSPASDQFALAATLYEAISGKRAFPGDDAVSVAAKIKTEDPQPFAADAGLAPGVDRALLRAMSRLPADRFPSCVAFGEALARALGGDRIASAGTGPAALPFREELPRERRLAQVLIGGGVVVTTAALLIWAAARAIGRPDDEVVLPPTPPATATASIAPVAAVETATARPRRKHAHPQPSASASVAPVEPVASASAAPAAPASAKVVPAATSASASPPVPPPP